MKRNIESFDSFVCAVFDDDVDPGSLPDGTVPLLQELNGVYVKMTTGGRTRCHFLAFTR